MLVSIANLFEADRISAVAGEALTNGMAVSLENTAGTRRVMKVDALADLKPGKCGIVWKVSVDPAAVDSSTTPTSWGSRILSIDNGDDVVLVQEGAYVTYDVAVMDASLDSARGGAAPAVGDRLGLKAGLFSTMGAASALITSTIGRVFEVSGTQVTVEITLEID